MARSPAASKKKSKPRPVKKSDGKINKWNKASDIPLDEEDQFHASRDKILLEGDATVGYDSDGDEDEVFGLKGLSDDDSEEEPDYEEEELEEEELEEEEQKKPTKKKSKNAAPVPEDSEAEEEESWGKSKSAYYSSNAYEVDSEDEEANALEEQEAKRLQAKTREALSDGDFGLDEVDEAEDEPKNNDDSELSMPVAALPTDKSKDSLIRHLEKTNPETLALAHDWAEVSRTLIKTKTKIEELESSDPEDMGLGMMHLYYQALLTYATTLAFYLHLRASPKYAANPQLLTAHPILSRLLTLKQGLETLEDLDFAVDSEGDLETDLDDSDSITAPGFGVLSDSGSEESDEDEFEFEGFAEDAEKLWALDRDENSDAEMDPDELKDLLMDVDTDSAPLLATRKSKPSVKKINKDKISSSDPDKPKKTKPVFDLIEPTFASSGSKPRQTTTNTADSFGESTTLHHADALDKSSNKKSLRFHTSKIESASARRAGARVRAGGGDDDIPYLERGKKADKVPKKMRGMGGEDLDATATTAEEKVEKGKKRAREDDEDVKGDEGPDGYYELVKKKKKQDKEEKTAEYEALTARPDLEESTAGGPRSLTRAILANKGLTPHRPKSVRNPRVKKRQKFEKAKRKVASQKAIYKGGVGGTGVYHGEKSGISKVVKSVRLG